MNPQLQKKLLEIDYLGSISSNLGWDESTQMPVKGAKLRGELQAYLSGQLQQKNIDPEFISLIDELADQATTDTEKAIVHNVKKNYKFYNAMPTEFYQELSKSFSEGFHAWEEARKHNDYKIYAPALQKNIELSRQLAIAMGFDSNPYNGLLDYYEDGLTTAVIDQIFEPVRTVSIDLMNQARNHPKIIINGTFPKNQQEAMALDLLEIIKFDMKAGHLTDSTHPFSSSSSPDDVRLTVNYNEKDFLDVFYAALHEGGHGLYEQNINSSLYGTTLCHGTAMSTHESCSRIMENQVGRSKEFLSFYQARLNKHFPELQKFSLDDLYRAANRCEPSLIRIHADEITYNLHIIIRYEMEKSILNDQIPVMDLPELWNSKYKEYLGIVPKNDVEGIMQDIHWSSLTMGYFPSYAIGSIYAAQLFETFQQHHHLDLSKGDISPLVHWMKEHVYQYGSIYSPTEVITKATGRSIDVQPYLTYLKNKIASLSI